MRDVPRRGLSPLYAVPLWLVAMPVAAGEFTLPPLDTFTATVERPLFTPGRRPPAAVPVPLEEAPVVEEAVSLYRLVGLIAEGGGRAVALLREGDSHGEIRVRPGETVAGWTVERIGGGEMTLSRDGETLALSLDGVIPP